MAERIGAVTMKGNPLTLTGHEIKAGDNAPAWGCWAYPVC